MSIDCPNHFTRSSWKSDRQLDHIFFGSLLSNEKFLIHQIPFSPTDQWKLKISSKQTLIIENQSSISLSILFKHLHKEILVIDGEDFSEIIFSYHFISIDRQKRRIYGNDPLVQSLNQCSDFLLSISPKSTADSFLDELQTNHQFRIFYTTITIQHNIHRWSNMDWNSYRTEHSRYALAILHSLGYVFDDKYLSNSILQRRMIELAEHDEKSFYQLCLEACLQLKQCHWKDLTSIFDKQSVKTNPDDQSIYVSVIHLTPTRCLIMAKEKTKGHRAMRHRSFQGVDHFCLVYLKPDSPNIYLNDNPQILEYFQEILETGLDLYGNRYHLFGSSNSQLREHSFWFIRAFSLEEVHQKRQILGKFDQIRNLGTYVARLGLWFSKTDPSDVSPNEFLHRISFLVSSRFDSLTVRMPMNLILVFNTVKSVR